MQDIYCLEWLGREERRCERMATASIAALAATLNLERAPASGELLPSGWHWLFFNPVVRQDELGEDGHPRRTSTSFLPPIALPRRMWAGSRLHYLAPLVVDSVAERSSRIVRITPKEGKSGSMCFVTVEHRISSGGRECIVEEQDIVYREATTGPGRPRLQCDPVDVVAGRDRTLVPNAVMLFRYSALTFNGHRIHYDKPYAHNVEHYSDLVVHGPLTATLLQDFAANYQPGRWLDSFKFKGLLPLYVDQPIVLRANQAADGTLQLQAMAPNGSVAMEATATFSHRN